MSMTPDVSAPYPADQKIAIGVRVEMLSDWHVGIGAGRHRSIDRLVARDRDGLPYIPASTLRGIWRDAAEQLAYALDDGTEGAWLEFCDGLFGDRPQETARTGTTAPVADEAPRMARLAVSDGRLGGWLRRVLTVPENADADWKTKRLREALTFVKPGVCIDRRTGMAKDDFLRFEEVACRGLVLDAQGELTVPAEIADTATAFLAAAARLIDRLGGKRRRGMGECEFSVSFDGTHLDVRTAADRLERLAEPPKPSRRLGADISVAYQDNDGPPDWLELPLTIALETPLIIPEEVLGNVITSRDYVPGTMLLGHVARAGAGIIPDIESRIASGRIRVMNATPLVDGVRSLPAPLCWRMHKNGSPSDIASRYGERTQHSSAQQQPVKGGYVAQVGGVGEGRLLDGVERQVFTHNTVLDKAQTPSSDVGGVYVYEALTDGLSFGSALRIDRSDLSQQQLEDLASNLSGSLRLGRATQAGYGQARTEAGEWSPPGDETANSVSSLLVWFVSDTLVEGECLAVGTTVKDIAGEICAKLNIDPETFDTGHGHADVRISRVDGWQRAWGLPRQTLITIAAGSVVELPYAAGRRLTEFDLQQLAGSGLGSRRAEGFGEIRCNHPFLAGDFMLREAATPDHASSALGPVHASSPSLQEQAALRSLEERAWRKYVKQQLETQLADAKRRKKVFGWESRNSLKPAASQLGSIRQRLARLDTAADLSQAKVLVEEIKNKESERVHRGAARKWPVEALEKLGNLLEQAASDPQEILKSFHLDFQMSGAVQVALDERARYVILMAFLIALRHHKRAGEGITSVQGEPMEAGQ